MPRCLRAQVFHPFICIFLVICIFLHRNPESREGIPSLDCQKLTSNFTLTFQILKEMKILIAFGILFFLLFSAITEKKSQHIINRTPRVRYFVPLGSAMPYPRGTVISRKDHPFSTTTQITRFELHSRHFLGVSTKIIEQSHCLSRKKRTFVSKN